MMRGLTQAIADFSAGFGRLEVPAQSLALARQAFTDVTGVMLAASNEPVVRLLKSLTGHESGPCSVLMGLATPRGECSAALVNGTAAHALDYDDVQFAAHPSIVLVPAIIAKAQACGASGLAALRAYVVGYEVWGELHSRESDPYHDKGWHPTAVLGTLAATAAAASLHGLDAQTTRHALSLAASNSSGVLANFGSMVKPMHAGKSAAAALQAVAYARAGITAGDDAIGAHDGLLAALSTQGRVDLTAQTRLGERWFSVSTPLVFKKYPVCFSAHRAIDAVLRLSGEHAVVPSDIETIEVSVRGTQARVLRFERPRTALEAKFSIQFAVACALLRGRVGLQDLQDGFISSAAVQSMFAKVRFIHLPPGADGRLPVSDRVVMTLNSGRVLDSGPLDRVQPHTELREKFFDCCAAGGYSDAAQLFDRIQALDKAPNLNEI